MATLSPTFRFNDGKCREAMEFYKGILGGELMLMTIGESPMAKEVPAEKQGYIMHSTLKFSGGTIIGSDMMRDRAVVGDAVGVSIECDSEEQLRAHFAKLAEGGEAFMEPELQFWGGVFGVATDKYGVEWMLNFQKEPMAK
jgi:PhnB protein